VTNRTVRNARRWRRWSLLVAGAFACAVAGPTASARAVAADDAPPAWQPPTPAEGAAVEAQVGGETHIRLAAADPDPGDVVHITAAALPPGAVIESTDGNPAEATIVFTAAPTDLGRSLITVVAEDSAAAPLSISLTLVLSVVPRHGPTSLVGPGPISRWAYVLVPTVARAAPAASAHVVARLSAVTADQEPNVVLALGEETDATGARWIRARLPILPNGSVGWIPATALDALRVIRTRLVVHRASLSIALYRAGKRIFRARIGIGRPFWPTPAGEFYVRERVAGFSDPFYGPIAFGLSARSNVLTDWPGGGFIGIHGTSMPWLLPGRVSHGCIRMRNADILRLARVLPLGTPVEIV
jgi:lipoprotein-anchoring transpeptidase ErfK/SrfK